MSADAAPSLADVLALLRAMLRAAVLSMADGLHRSPDGAADPDAKSKAFAALADAYRSLSEDGPPVTLGDAVTTIARVTAASEILVRALDWQTVPLNASMSDASEASLWRALKDATSHYSFGARHLLRGSRSEIERAALRPASDHFLQAYALCLDRGAGRVHPAQVGDALASAWSALGASGRAPAREFYAACGLSTLSEDRGGPDVRDAPEESGR
jgi:hypothetical protein